MAGVAGVVLVLEQELFDLADARGLRLGDDAAEFGAVADEFQALFFGVADVEAVHAAGVFDGVWR